MITAIVLLIFLGITVISSFYALGGLLIFLKFRRIERKFDVKIDRRKIIVTVILWPIVTLHLDGRVTMIPRRFSF